MTTPPDLEALAKIETHEEVLAAFRCGVSVVDLVNHVPRLQRIRAEREELERLAIPLYRDELRGVPFYSGWKDEDWKKFIGSRYVEAQERVAAHLAGLPWPPEA